MSRLLTQGGMEQQGGNDGNGMQSWGGVKRSGMVEGEGEASFLSCSQSINDTVVMKCHEDE